MSKHTLGPWYYLNKVDMREGDDWEIFFNSNISGINYLIAEKISTQANARLIAAAPDLLEALKDMVRYLDNNGKETDVSELARYAIRKAEGGDA